MVSPYNKPLALPWVMGGWDTETLAGLARLSKEINRQAAMIGYINAFGFYTLCLGARDPADPAGRPPRQGALGIRRQEPSACMTSPNSSQVSPLKR